MAAQPSPFESRHAPNFESPPVDEQAAFLEALAQTMRATLIAQEARSAEEIDRRREEQLAAINALRESAATRMRELAEEDRTAIGRWAADERMRIQLERERRTRELEADLETSLAEHGSRIEAEIKRGDAAIAAYRAQVADFFAALANETDPVAIAQQASRRPQFPVIDPRADEVVDASAPVQETAAPAVEEVAVGGPTDAVAPGVPVMDPIAAKRAEWWAAWKDLREPPELGEVLATAEAER